MMLVGTDISVRLGGRVVLADAAVTCAEGRITGLVGPNGAGKTTLMRAMAGLVVLERGHVALGGESVTRLPPSARGRRIAYLPQERAVHWPLAARRVVALGRLPHRGSSARAAEADHAAVDEAMQAMDIAHLAERPVAALSGGELARVLIARALAQEAPVILADEPTAGLDPAHALGLFAELQRLAARGRIVVVALHDLSLAARFCHDVVMLAGGKVAAAGSAAEVLTPRHLASVFGVRMAVGSVGGAPVVMPLAPLGPGGGPRDADPK